MLNVAPRIETSLGCRKTNNRKKEFIDFGVTLDFVLCYEMATE